ncbi:nucleolar protein [Naganishia albida]|nr:nucleolar protein [Naganishia albida]
MAKKTAATAVANAAKSPKAANTPEKRSTRSTTTATAVAASTPTSGSAAKPTSASKKRKTAEDFLDSAPGKEESVKKARGTPAGKKTASTPGKDKEVSISKPAVTGATTVDKLPLPTTKEPVASKGKKAVPAKKAAPADPGLVQPSAEKPAEGLKSALKKTTKAPTPAPAEKATKKKAPAVSKKAPAPAEDDGFVHGFSSSEGEESEDDDDSDIEMDGGKGKSSAVDVKTLPTIAKDDKSVQRKLTKAKKKQDNERGVLYLGRIPHGFYEDEMKAYFSQFGDVTRLRLARNRKTGASKHFAYIEMSSKAVAEITAETMNNYLLMGHILQCHVVPQDKLHPDLWVGANKKWRRVPASRVERSSYGKERSEEEQAKVRAKLFKKDQARQQKIKDLGIDYEYEGFSKPNGAEDAQMKA